ncbi:MAG: hypothetical protein Q9212_005680 [Teloschistes hypoglaucus]
MTESRQGLNLQNLSTSMASPRMWPIGYIIDSPYSPLHLEGGMRFNWRDSFEDLLAIEAGGSMIASENRKAEDTFSAYRWYLDSSWIITQTNHVVRENNQEIFPALKRDHEAALKRQDYRMAEEIEDVRCRFKSNEVDLIANASHLRKSFEKVRYSKASRFKDRGQWMASLITSGALPNWTWHVSNSMEGRVVSFSNQNTDSKVELGIRVSELELVQHFKQGQPYQMAEPVPLPEDQIKIVLAAPPKQFPAKVSPHPFEEDLKPSQTSVIAQAARTETLKLPDGSSVIKILLTNTLANGTSVTNQFVQEPEKILEEVDNANISMRLMLEDVRRLTSPKKATFAQRFPETHRILETIIIHEPSH